MVPPVLLLSVLIATTAVAAVVAVSSRKARAARLAKLAGEWGMKFAEDDRFVLAPRVAAALPTPGAADVLVRDLIYAQDTPTAGGAYRYYFTVEYTTGVLRTKRRRVSAGMIVESSPGLDRPRRYSHVTLAPPDCDLVGQYRRLRDGV